MLFAIAVCTFLTMTVVVLLIYQHFVNQKQIISDRLERYVHERQPATALPVHHSGSAPARGWRVFVRRCSKPFRAAAWARRMEHQLLQAGLPLRGAEFLVVCLACGLFMALVLLLLTGGKPVFLAVGAGSGYLLPILYMRLKISRRLKAFNDQLVDALTLIANSLRTGYSFLQAVEMVAREMPQPLAAEFGRTLKEMNLGVTTETALNNMAKRVNSDDLDLVITAVLIQRQVGGNLAEVMENIAGTIRSRIKIKGEIKTLTAQGRMSGLIIGLLPFVLGAVISILNPEYIGLLFKHPLGKLMLAGAVVSQIIGLLLIRKIVNIEV